MISCLSLHVSKCYQLSHCSYDNSILCFQSVKIIYRHVIAIYHQDFLFFEDSPVVAFLFLPLFFSTFSLERLSLRTAGFSVRSKHFSKRSMSLCGPVKMYSHGISMPNPHPLLTAFPHTLTTPLVPGFARKCLISPKPSFVLTNIKGMCYPWQRWLHFCLLGSLVLVEVVDFLRCEESTTPCRHETLLSMIERLMIECWPYLADWFSDRKTEGKPLRCSMQKLFFCCFHSANCSCGTAGFWLVPKI